MKIEQAIKYAIEGGYNQNNLYPSMKRNYIEINEALLDPKFWQALGKSRGWKNHRNDSDSLRCTVCGRAIEYQINEENECFKNAYLYYWHNLIDALAEGKTIEDYFEKLN